MSAVEELPFWLRKSKDEEPAYKTIEGFINCRFKLLPKVSSLKYPL